MPWIKVIPESEAEDDLKKVYEKLREQRKNERINRERGKEVPISPLMLQSLNWRSR